MFDRPSKSLIVGPDGVAGRNMATFLSHALPFKECVRSSEPYLQVVNVRFVLAWQLCSYLTPGYSFPPRLVL